MNKFFKETNEQLVRNNLAIDEIIISYIDSLRKKTLSNTFLFKLKKYSFKLQTATHNKSEIPFNQ